MPTTLRNINPVGEVRVFGRTVGAGEEFEVSDEHAAALLEQTGNYEVAKPVDEMTVEELTTYAANHDIDLGDATKKADLLATIKKES
jgi:hypothetical protein